MTTQSPSTLSAPAHARKKSLFDALIDGLLAGLIAGIVMAAYLAVVVLLNGTSAADLFAGFDVTQARSPLAGVLAHLGVAAAYGTAFGAVTWLLPGRWQAPWFVLGLTYGLILMLLSVLLPRGLPGLPAPMAPLPAWHAIVAHVLYGLTVGAGIGLARR